ncbi:MAG TPA: hypothetical protein VEU11_05825 [Terriglobales bacterium]|nr:hypothetical protein [Terriglobales bacterium]
MLKVDIAAKKAEVLRRLPEVRKAIEKAMTDGNWLDAGRLYSEVNWAKPDDPDLRGVRARLEPELLKIVQTNKEMIAMRTAILKNVNAPAVH